AGGGIEVAVISDTAPILQGLRAEIRPEGSEIDGIAGAAIFQTARMEIDYLSRPVRVVFSCPAGAPPQTCRAIGRCPRLPGAGATRVCFGLPEHGLPTTCDNLPATCP